MADTLPFTFKFLNLQNEKVEVEIGSGKIVYVIGVNGSGKSSMLGHLTRANLNHSLLVLAHRQIWISQNVSGMNAAQRAMLRHNIMDKNARPDSRWQDYDANQKAHLSIGNFIAKINKEARDFREVARKNPSAVEPLASNDTPLELLNKHLRNGNLKFRISMDGDDGLLATDKKGSTLAIALLSDGERNALLLIVDVLSAPANTLLLIDEPERHLHRSIISPLLSSLLKERTDCGFVVATHDVSLPLDSPASTVLLLRECAWYSEVDCGWDANVVKGASNIPLDIKKDILGARKKILFVEGAHQSLDNSLYQILFPDVTVIPKGNCRSVCHAVDGILTTESLNWANAFGLIDRDSRSAQEIEDLQTQKIFALRCYSVETLYYSVSMIRRMAARKTTYEGGDPDALVHDALEGLLRAVSEQKETLCARLCHTIIRDRVQMPTVKEIIAKKKITPKEIDTEAEMRAEIAVLDKFISEKDFDSIVSRYPLRLSPALERIATALRYTDETHYEDAVRIFLQQDEDARLECRKELEPLTSALDAV